MVIDVIGAEGGAGEALEEIVFFVGSAIRADEADGIGAVLGVNFFELGGGGLRGFFPGDGKELVALAQERLTDALFVLREIETEAAFYEQKIVVNAGKVAIVGAHDFVIAYAERDFAAVGAVRARCGDVLHLPRARLVAIGAAGERAERANVDAHAALFALEVIFAIGDDDAVGAAHADTERLHVHAFVANAHAAEAEDAARGVVVDPLRPLFFGAVNFFLDEAAGVRAVTEDHVLQFALAAFVADRAIARVIGQQKFQHVLSGVAHLIGSGADDHAFGGDDGASGLQLGKFLDFDQAHAARGLQRQARVVAERRNFGADAARRFDQQRSRGDLHVAIVNLQGNQFLLGCSFSH